MSRHDSSSVPAARVSGGLWQQAAQGSWTDRQTAQLLLGGSRTERCKGTCHVQMQPLVDLKVKCANLVSALGWFLLAQGGMIPGASWPLFLPLHHIPELIPQYF